MSSMTSMSNRSNMFIIVKVKMFDDFAGNSESINPCPSKILPIRGMTSPFATRQGKLLEDVFASKNERKSKSSLALIILCHFVKAFPVSDTWPTEWSSSCILLRGLQIKSFADCRSEKNFREHHRKSRELYTSKQISSENFPKHTC